MNIQTANKIRKVVVIASYSCFSVSFSYLLLLKITGFDKLNYQEVIVGITHTTNLIIVGIILITMNIVIEQIANRWKKQHEDYDI